MLSVAEALNRIFQSTLVKLPTEVSLADAHGLILAEDVPSDVDSPPHDKSMVDGFAVRSADLIDGQAVLKLREEIVAGALPMHAVTAGYCSRIMTGAPIPDGADAVVMVECMELFHLPVEVANPLARTSNSEFDHDGDRGEVHLRDSKFRKGQNIMPRGTSLRKGDTVLKGGTKLSPAEIGLLAEVGRARILVIGPVRVSILSTGNELVPTGAIPGPGQIRNSNGPMLFAAVQKAGAIATDLGIARDSFSDLQRLIALGLESDILLISGGVSEGTRDLVPNVLKQLRVREVFHKVKVKPGKPLWFGTVGDDQRISDAQFDLDANSHLVFGLPGNPISSFVCFELFVKVAIARMLGQFEGRKWDLSQQKQSVALSSSFEHRGDRPTYHPAKFTSSADGDRVEPTAWRGSADLRGFAGANSLIVFPAGDRCYQAGDAVDVIML